MHAWPRDGAAASALGEHHFDSSKEKFENFVWPLQVYLILDEFIMGGELQETSKKVSAPTADGPLSGHSWCAFCLRLQCTCCVPPLEHCCI